MLETRDAVALRDSHGICNAVAGIESSCVAKPLSWSRIKTLREAMFAKKISDDEDDDSAEETVVCDHISMLAVMHFLDQHDSLGFRIRFDPEKGQDTNAHPEKIMGRLIALEVPSHTHDAAATEITEQIKGAVKCIVDEQTLRTWSSPSYRIGACLKEPDSAIGPRGHESESLARKATTVVEVVYLQQRRGRGVPSKFPSAI